MGIFSFLKACCCFSTKLCFYTILIVTEVRVNLYKTKGQSSSEAQPNGLAVAAASTVLTGGAGINGLNHILLGHKHVFLAPIHMAHIICQRNSVRESQVDEMAGTCERERELSSNVFVLAMGIREMWVLDIMAHP